MTDQKQRFALRKYGVGLASVLIGLTFLWGGAAVHADSTAVTGPAVKTVKVQAAQTPAKASAQSSTSQASSSAVSGTRSDASQDSSAVSSQQGGHVSKAAAVKAAQLTAHGHHVFGIIVRLAALDALQQEILKTDRIAAAAAAVQLLIKVIDIVLHNRPPCPLYCVHYTAGGAAMICCFSWELCRLRHIALFFRRKDEMRQKTGEEWHILPGSDAVE